MYNVDKIKNFFDCDLCLQVLVDPITIPCGSNVCKSHLDKTISTDIEQSKKELDDYVKRFDTFEIDENKFESIKRGVVGVNGKFDKIILDYNNALIENKKYSFGFDEIPIADIFGRFYGDNYARDIQTFYLIKLN
jgi:hypothetical protein